jgi:hypothetical protein
MPFVKLLAIVWAVSIPVRIGLISFLVILNPRSVGDIHGAGCNPSDFALETLFSGLIVVAMGAILVIAAAAIGRGSK